MDGFDLPMSFGKKAKPKANPVKARVEETKREDAPVPVSGTKRPHEDIEEKKPIFTASMPTTASDNRPDPVTSHEHGINVKQEANGTDLHEGEAGPSMPKSNGPNSASKPKLNAQGIVDDDDDYDSEDDADAAAESGQQEEEWPITHEIVLKDHTKVVSAIAIDGPGARIATGSHDYDVKMWDFGGMDARTRPFKSFEPSGNYHIHNLDYSPDSKLLLVISGTTQPKVYTREGEDPYIYPKGDPYIRDMKHTKGHVADMTSGQFHPLRANEFLTASNDTTLRIWDVEDRTKQKSVIVVKSKERGTRTKVTACAYSRDGRTIAGVCEDGALHLWATSSNLIRPNLSNEQAHARGTATSGVVFSSDGRQLATRGADDTVKLWDVRSLKQPVSVATDLLNLYPETNVIFSPDDRFVLTGVGSKEKGGKGEIVALDRYNGLQVNRRIPVGTGSVVRVAWHARINQIFATTSLGSCHVLYHPSHSTHGALLPLSKMPRTRPREAAFVSEAPQVILTPHALPMFQDEDYHQQKRKKEKERLDPVKSHKPVPPVVGRGQGGRIGASAQQHVVQNLFKIQRDEDPREALLKYADRDADPKFTAAWKQTQPKPIFSQPIPDATKKQDSDTEKS